MTDSLIVTTFAIQRNLWNGPATNTATVSPTPPSTTLITTNLPSDGISPLLWIILAGIIFVTCTVSMICYFSRKRLRSFIQTCLNKRLPHPILEEVAVTNEQPINERLAGDEAETILLSNLTESGEGGEDLQHVPDENASDSGVSLENSSVHTVNEASDVERGGYVSENVASRAAYTEQQHQPEQNIAQNNNNNNDNTTCPDLVTGTMPIKHGVVPRLAIGQTAGTNYLSFQML